MDDVRVGGIFVYICVWVGVFSIAYVGFVDIWSPQAVGVIGQALFIVHVFVLLKNTVVCRK